MKHLFFILMLMGSVLACKKERSGCGNIQLTACLQEKLAEYKANATAYPCSGYKVKEYNFKGSRVFLFAAPNCIADGQDVLLNTNCDTICFLGGLFGKQTCEGLKFDSAARFVQTVWEP